MECVHMEDSLQLHSRGSASKLRRLHPGGKTWDDLDSQVLDFLVEERAAGRAVSNLDLKEKALELARTMSEVQGFAASDGWIRRWKKRNHVGIKRGTNESQKLPQDYASVVKDFKVTVDRFRGTWNYTDFNIGNMDQTMCRFDMVDNSTNNIQGEKDVRISTTGGAKRGFTFALAATASGHKLPAYVVLKEPSGRIPTRVFASLNIPTNVRLAASPNGWMTGPLMREWIERIWGPNRHDVRRLLVLDQARIHTMQMTKDQLEECETDLVFIPADCTPIIRPADVAWNKPFKSQMRKEYKTWRRIDLRTPRGNLKMATRQDILRWVSIAWKSVGDDIIRGSFKSCATSAAEDGSDDHLLNDRLADALNEADMQEADGTETLDLLFDEEGSESDFSAFSEGAAED